MCIGRRDIRGAEMPTDSRGVLEEPTIVIIVKSSDHATPIVPCSSIFVVMCRRAQCGGRTRIYYDDGAGGVNGEWKREKKKKLYIEARI